MSFPSPGRERRREHELRVPAKGTSRTVGRIDEGRGPPASGLLGDPDFAAGFDRVGDLDEGASAGRPRGLLSVSGVDCQVEAGSGLELNFGKGAPATPSRSILKRPQRLVRLSYRGAFGLTPTAV